MIKVSVIVPAESFSDNLSKCMDALKKQTFKNFEIITVLDKFSGKPAAKRNWGARRAKGEILAFLDDDCIADKDWIRNGVREFTKEVGAVAGPMLMPEDSPFMERAAGCLLESPIVMGTEYYRNCISEKREVDDYPSANFFIRKADFLKLGGFDERFWPGEDTKLCLDIIKKLKKKIVYEPGVIVNHRRRPLFRPCTRRCMASPFLEQVARYGRQRGKFVRLFPKTSRKWYYFLPSVFLAGVVVLGILGELGILGIYLSIIIIESFRIFMKEKNILVIPVFIIGVLMTHIVYGLSFLGGLSYLGKTK